MAEEIKENNKEPGVKETKTNSGPILVEGKTSPRTTPGPRQERQRFIPSARFRERGREQGEFESKLLDLARVVRVSAGGKRLRFRAAVVIGNKMGKVGFGVAKGTDVAQAVDKATRVAKKNIIVIPLENETIPHQVKAKFGAAEVLLRSQRKGRGMVAGGTVRVICSLGGIKNVSSKLLGRTGNKINNAKATIAALKKLKSRSSEENQKYAIK